MQALLGDPGNRRQMRRAVSRVVCLRRYEQMSVQHALHRLRQTQMPALRSSPGASEDCHTAPACQCGASYRVTAQACTAQSRLPTSRASLLSLLCRSCQALSRAEPAALMQVF